jgi:hypothetical protein
MTTKNHRGCVFCGGSPLTKEHIWSDWLDSILPRALSHRLETRESAIAKAVVNGQPLYAPPSRSDRLRQGAVHTLKTRTVCKRCNGGWMKGIVDRAKPVAEGVIKLQARVLTQDAQASLAAWLALSAVMRDQKATAHPQKMQRDVLQCLFSSGLPPADFFVAIGAFFGPRSVADSYNVRLFRRTAPPHHVVSSLHSVAVSMGGLFAVMIAPWRIDPTLQKRLPAIYADSLTPIWPSQERQLPWPNFARRVLRGAFSADAPGSAYEVALRARKAYSDSFEYEDQNQSRVVEV